MDTHNKHENRAQQRAANEPKNYTIHLPSLLAKAFSVDENIRVELSIPMADYSREKTLSGSVPLSAQADPNTTAPLAAEIWDLKGYRGGHGYVILDQTEQVDIELWCKDSKNNKWMKTAEIVGVESYEEFEFPEEVKGRSIWLRLVNIGLTITDITLRFSPQ